MIEIDGSQGEGGGQILRTALSLSMITGEAFRIDNIRAKRSRPGLMRQHLTAVRAAAEISEASVGGAEIGASTLTFRPGGVRPGDYIFAIGTAGSTTLVLQTVLPALMQASAPSRLTLEGGTHNPHCPPFDFLETAFLPILRRQGVGVAATLERPGFYPAGGGRFIVEIEPAMSLARLDINTRGAAVSRHAVVTVANLPFEIASREAKAIGREMEWSESEVTMRTETRSQGPGNVLVLTVAFEEVTEVFTGFGERGVSAENVVARAAKNLRRYLASDAAVGPHLADQLLLPFALAGGGSFTTLRPSQHALTNAEVIKAFLPLRPVFRQDGDKLWRVEIGPAG